MRDQQREREISGGESVQNQACAYLWRELVGEYFHDCRHDLSGLMDWLQCRELETANAVSRLLQYCR
jgi:hypothetical protein